MDYVLSMPAVSFWAFLKQVQKTRAAEAIQELDAAIVPSMSYNYYDSKRNEYLSIIHRDAKSKKKNLPQDKGQMDRALNLSDPVAQAMIKKVFKAHRRSKYGR